MVARRRRQPAPSLPRRAQRQGSGRSDWRPLRGMPPRYNRRMPYRVTLIPGDGIGPELAEATRRVLDASGVAFDWEVQDAGEGVMAQYGTPLPDHVLESIRRNKVALKGPITTPVGSGFRSVNVDPAPDAGPVRQPSPGPVDQGPRDALRGRGPRDRAREHRGPVRRHRAHGRPGRRREHQDHHPGRVRADRPVRVRVRRGQRPPQGDRGPQGQHHEALGRPVPRELPDGRAGLRGQGRVRGPDRRQHVHAARAEAGAVRRDGPARTCTATSSATCAPASSAAWASRPAPTSARRRRSSRRSTDPRPSTRA